MEISEAKYRYWQGQLAVKKWYRYFWVWWGIYSVLLSFFAGGFLLLTDSGRKPVLLAFGAFLFAKFVACEAIHAVYKKVHPYQKFNFMPPSSWVFCWTDNRHDAFPSEHVASLAVISGVLFYFYPVLGFVGFAVSVLASMARIVLGYHQLSEILAGWVVGIVCALAAVYWISPLLFTLN